MYRTTWKPTIELHLNTDPGFPRKYGKKVKSLGGRYEAARGDAYMRCVYVPDTDAGIELAEKMVEDFGRFQCKTRYRPRTPEQKAKRDAAARCTVIFNDHFARWISYSSNVKYVRRGETVRSARESWHADVQEWAEGDGKATCVKSFCAFLAKLGEYERDQAHAITNLADALVTCRGAGINAQTAFELADEIRRDRDAGKRCADASAGDTEHRATIAGDRLKRATIYCIETNRSPAFREAYRNELRRIRDEKKGS